MVSAFVNDLEYVWTKTYFSIGRILALAEYILRNMDASE